MTKKLENIWECSRLVLPEHKQLIINEEREQGRRTRPVLDPQKVELIERALYKSMEDHSAITLTLYDPFEHRVAKGIMMKVDRQLGIKFRWSEDEWDWIKIDDVTSATI
ncbi:YolD-like family protein [Paenibacillus monticola]|uniref:YolD-like family protein n=1 Tax=Paenibacillus monticola TaxID=2666075 RepID=A0A7X2H1V3_9BACL|nr:YolD-like family protein [Paenibacillus monticola]MRN52010.1 YolD-like family protein [Paenibacillus monticola]